MLIKLIRRDHTPTQLATTMVEGGLIFSRDHPQLRRAVVSTVYKRNLPERPRRRYPVFRRRRGHRGVRRTLQLGHPPRLLATSLTWKNWLTWTFPPGPQRGTAVAHPGHRRWVRWSRRYCTGRRGRYHAGYWARRPHSQHDPLLLQWSWLHRQGTSPLRGRYARLTRASQLTYRLRGLFRRERHYRQIRLSAERTHEYVRYYHHKRRRKLDLPNKLYHLFRRRRLRTRHRRGTSLKAHLRGVTRQTFHRVNGHRYVQAEKATLLSAHPDPYYVGLARWVSHTWSQRVGSVWEYNYHQPMDGYYRFEKKRRADARRWKLGQHPLWATLFHQARQLRWDRFANTTLANLTLPTLVVPPLVNNLNSSLYWSTQPWGRGRWGRPDRRAAHVFVKSVKSGTMIEEDATQWGGAATGPTGVLQACVVEREFRTFPVLETVSQPVVSPGEKRVAGFSLSVSDLYRDRAYLCWWVTVGWLWWAATPLWWSWWIVSRSWCFLLWVGYRGWSIGRSFAQALAHGVGHFFLTELAAPATRVVTHWIKERPLVKTGSWLWTAWLLAYTNDNQQAELETPFYEDTLKNLANEEEIDPEEEHEVEDEDDLDVGAHTHDHPFVWFQPQWNKDVDSFVDDWKESLLDWITEEVPHQLGLWCRPLVDVVVRLPIWAVAEGVSLFSLWCKLEWQARWFTWLTYGNANGVVRGRWWKVPLVLLAVATRVAAVAAVGWFIFSQVDYSAVRVGLTYSWGIPWREEYYAAWFFISGLSAVALVGPTSWKDYLFQELGLDTLLGTYFLSAQLGTEEDYYLTRPPGWLEKTATRLNPHHHKTTALMAPGLTDQAGWWDRRSVTSYDETRLRLAHHYGYQNYGYDSYIDFAMLYFLFPIHQPARDHNENWFPLEKENSKAVRAARDTFGQRYNYYRYYDGEPVFLKSIPYRALPHSRQVRTTFIPDGTD